MTRRDRLLDWLRADTAHHGLDDDQIYARSRLYDIDPTRGSWRTTRDLHELLHEGLVVTDNPWNGRWWPNPTTERTER